MGAKRPSLPLNSISKPNCHLAAFWPFSTTAPDSSIACKMKEIDFQNETNKKHLLNSVFVIEYMKYNYKEALLKLVASFSCFRRWTRITSFVHVFHLPILEK